MRKREEEEKNSKKNTTNSTRNFGGINFNIGLIGSESPIESALPSSKPNLTGEDEETIRARSLITLNTLAARELKHLLVEFLDEYPFSRVSNHLVSSDNDVLKEMRDLVQHLKNDLCHSTSGSIKTTGISYTDTKKKMTIRETMPVDYS